MALGKAGRQMSRVMRFLESLGFLPKGDHQALRFSEAEHWSLEPSRDPELFFRSLADFAPEGSIAYLEDSTDVRYADYLRPLVVANPTTMGTATIFPKPDRFHVPATEMVLRGLADLVSDEGSAFPVFHFALYEEERVLLEWLDVFHDDEMVLSSSFPEAVINQFASALGVSYRWNAGK